MYVTESRLSIEQTQSVLNKTPLTVTWNLLMFLTRKRYNSGSHAPAWRLLCAFPAHWTWPSASPLRQQQRQHDLPWTQPVPLQLCLAPHQHLLLLLTSCSEHIYTYSACRAGSGYALATWMQISTNTQGPSASALGVPSTTLLSQDFYETTYLLTPFRHTLNLLRQCLNSSARVM